MKTYKELLSELFDKPLPYKLVHSIEDREEVYAFKTPKGQHFEASITVDKRGAYEFSFVSDSSEDGTKSNKGEQFQVFSTVTKIFSEFIKDEAPDHWFVEAVTSEPSRLKLFSRMVNKFVRLNKDYKVTESERYGLHRWDVKVS